MFHVNAFRVLELPVSATERDVSRRVQQWEIRARLEGGTSTGGVNGVGALPRQEPPDIHDVREAALRLRDPEKRFIDEFFWFWTANDGADEAALLDALRLSDIDAASRILSEQSKRRGEERDGITSHNLAVLFHCAALDVERSLLQQPPTEKQLQRLDYYWREAFAHWNKLLASENFWDRQMARIRELNDPRLTEEYVRSLRSSLPSLLLSVNAELALRAASKGLASECRRQREVVLQTSGFPAPIRTEALQRAVKPYWQQIIELSEKAKREALASPLAGLERARQLLAQVRQPLSVLDMLLPTDNNMRTEAHDEAADNVSQCALLYYQQTPNATATLNLLREALKLSVGPRLRARLYDVVAVLMKTDLANNLVHESKLQPVSQPKPAEEKIDTNFTLPTLSTLNGIGTMFYGFGNYRTQYFTVVFLPIIPLARYRVNVVNGKYIIYGRVPLKFIHFWPLLLIFGFTILTVLSGQMNRVDVKQVNTRVQVNNHVANANVFIKRARQYSEEADAVYLGEGKSRAKLVELARLKGIRLGFCAKNWGYAADVLKNIDAMDINPHYKLYASLWQQQAEKYRASASALGFYMDELAAPIDRSPSAQERRKRYADEAARLRQEGDALGGRIENVVLSHPTWFNQVGEGYMLYLSDSAPSP